MALNVARGFRRLGLVAAVPLSLFPMLILSRYATETEVVYVNKLWLRSPRDAVPSVEDDFQKAINGKTRLEIPGVGMVYFPTQIPQQARQNLMNDLSRKTVEPNLERFRVIVVEEEYKSRTSMWKLSGIVILSLAGTILLIQAFISVIVWIARGFKQ